MKDICLTGSFIHRVQRSGVSTTLMTACNCSITHTNVHSGPLFPAKKMHFHCGPGCQRPGVTANRVEPLRCGNRKNNVIFIRRDMGCPAHYHSAVVNGIFCLHSHERTRHLPVPPNWLFTVFQHGPIFHRPHFVVQSDAVTNLLQRFPQSWCHFIFWQSGQVFFPSPWHPLSSISGPFFFFLMLKNTLNTVKVQIVRIT